MNKQKALDILNIIYIRLMRLQLSYKTFDNIYNAPTIASNYPNLCWCMQATFATDAYTTIDGLMYSGRYSFETLAKDNKAVKEKYKETNRKIEKTIPNFHITRNQMFCHLVQKQANDAIWKMNSYCWEIIDYLQELHLYCCSVYGIDTSELNGYSNETFMALDREFEEFNKLLMAGSRVMFCDTLTKIQEGKSLKDVKEIRHKQVKTEK